MPAFSIQIRAHHHIAVYIDSNNANNIHHRYNMDFCCINKISNELNLSVLNLNDMKTRNCKILVASATCVLNRENVITYYTYIIENSLTIISFQGDFPHDVKIIARSILGRDVDVDFHIFPHRLCHNLKAT